MNYIDRILIRYIFLIVVYLTPPSIFACIPMPSGERAPITDIQKQAILSYSEISDAISKGIVKRIHSGESMKYYGDIVATNFEVVLELNNSKNGLIEFARLWCTIGSTNSVMECEHKETYFAIKVTTESRYIRTSNNYDPSIALQIMDYLKSIVKEGMEYNFDLNQVHRLDYENIYGIYRESSDLEETYKVKIDFPDGCTYRNISVKRLCKKEKCDFNVTEIEGGGLL